MRSVHYDQPFTRGYDAYRHRNPMYSNPYAWGTSYHVLWERGWKSAHEKYQYSINTDIVITAAN